MDIIKRWLCGLGLAVMLSGPAFGAVNIDATNFPDTNFRNYVSSEFDKNADGTLSEVEISRATEINIQGQGTMALTGIEKLTGLKRLHCDYAITSGGSPNFNYTSFKASYGLNCEVDDSYFLVMHIQDSGRGGMMTPYVMDVLDRSSGDYVLKPHLYNNQTLNSLEFRTKGTPALEVHVAP